MKIHIQTTNIELTDALSQYVDDKVSQIDKVLDPEDTSVFCDVEIGTITNHHQTGEIFRAELNLRAAGSTFRTTSEKEDLYLAINEAKEDMINTVNAHREKQRDMEIKGGAEVKKMMKNLPDA